MMKWLRAHTKQIMVVVVLLAMFSFVGAQGLYSLLAPNAADVVLWRAFGRDVTQAEVNQAKYETDLLSGMGIRWQMPAKEEFQLRHWYMLAEEARRGGITAADTDIERTIARVDSNFAEAGGIDIFRKRFSAGLPQIREAIARNRIVQENAIRVIQAAMPSEPQIRHYVRDTQDKVTIKMAVFDATKFVDETVEIPEPEIQAQYEKYRDVMPDESEDGYGYRFPRRVSIQYVSISPTALRQQVDVTEEEAIDYWKRNKGKYTEIVEVDVPPDPNATSQPAKPEKINKTVQMPFSKARARVENELRIDKSFRISRQAANRLADELSEPWHAAPRDDTTGYKAIPDEARNPDAMRNAMLRVAADLGVELDYGQLDRVSEEDIATNDKVRNAALPGDDNQLVPISELAFRIPMFHTPEHPEDSGLRLQRFQTPPSPMVEERATFGRNPVTGQFEQQKQLNKYVIFRVIDAFEAGPPATLDEVRDHVVSDLREKRAYEAMASVATEFAAVASRLGAEPALTMFDELRTVRGIRTIQSPPEFARMQRRAVRADELRDDESMLEPAQVPGIGRSGRFIEAVFAMADEDWTAPSFDAGESERVSRATTQPAAKPAPKVQLVNLPALRKRVVVELEKHEPVDTNSYATEYRENAVLALKSVREQKLLIEWSDPKNIEARCNFVNVRGAEQKPDDSDETGEENVASGGDKPGGRV